MPHWKQRLHTILHIHVPTLTRGSPQHPHPSCATQQLCDWFLPFTIDPMLLHMKVPIALIKNARIWQNTTAPPHCGLTQALVLTTTTTIGLHQSSSGPWSSLSRWHGTRRWVLERMRGSSGWRNSRPLSRHSSPRCNTERKRWWDLNSVRA